MTAQARLGDPKLALLLALAIVLSVVGLWAGLRALAPSPAPPATVFVTMRIEASDWSLTYEAATSNNTVLRFLLEAAAVLGFQVEYTYWEGLGASYVDAIRGVRDGQGGLHWQYWVNGEFAGVGADSYILEDGDAVLWRHAPPLPEG